MGLVGKIALIGIVAVAVILAVVWDIHNQSKIAAREKANAAETSSAQTAQTQPADTAVPVPSVSEASLPVPPVSNTSPPARTVSVVTGQPAQPQPVQSQPRPPASTASQRYIIKKGDTLISIAKRYYGDGLKWKVIYEANREVITDANFLPIGREIVIPPVKTAEKMAALEHPARTTYIVQKDDTLTKIAERHYGDPARWKDIYQANKEKIPNKDSIVPGTVLVIPDLSPER
jgi:nucleoid-associated protein YgaU